MYSLLAHFPNMDYHLSFLFHTNMFIIWPLFLYFCWDCPRQGCVCVCVCVCAPVCCNMLSSSVLIEQCFIPSCWIYNKFISWHYDWTYWNLLVLLHYWLNIMEKQEFTLADVGRAGKHRQRLIVLLKDVIKETCCSELIYNICYIYYCWKTWGW